MSYTLFDPAKPDTSTGSGAVLGITTRANLLAMRDAITMGVMPGWNFSVSGGTASQPNNMLFTKGTEVVKAALTWVSGNVTQTTYSYSSNSGTNYDVIGTETNTWDVNGNLTATTWS